MADRFESRIVVWLAALFCCGCGTHPAAQFVRQIPWADQGEWLKVDSHIHTRFSDGEHQPVEIAAKAIEHGCDAIAFTDHADSNLTAATPEYFEAIEVARRQFPGLIILAGLEWNVPPDGGDTHAVLLVPPGSDEEPLLREFKQRFDDLTVNEADTAKPLIHTNQRYLNGLQFLASRKTGDGTRPLLVFEHVGRKSESTVTSLDRLRLARKTNDVAVGLSGAPGHLADNSGSYRGNVRLIDRWDPAVAEIGGVWDQLLQAGDDVWGAGAPSDFHNLKLDYWPGQFSETWVRVPERTPEGVLAGLRAGTYFGVHGHIARQVDLRVEASGLARPARAGEVLEVLPQQSVEVVLALDAPARDWEGRPSVVDAVDLIAITAAGARVVETSTPDADGTVRFASQIVPRGGVVFRARGRSPARDGLSYVFYTNPIRIQEAEIGYWNIARLSTVLKKLRENWRPLSAAVLLMLAGLGLLGRPLARPGRGRGSRPRRLSTFRARRVFFAGAIGLVGVAIYASLIPFQYAETTLSDAWVQLRQSAAPGVHLSRADIAINVLIGIPLAFCGLSSLGTPRSLGIGRALIAALLTVVTCGGFAVGLELSQCWFPPRVPAASDVAAQTAGAILGATLWGLSSHRISLSVEKLFRTHSLASRRDWVLQFYVVVYLVWHWLPLDVVLSPSELLEKLRQGSLELIPFTLHFKSRSDEVYSHLSALMRAIPIGVWAALAWTRSGRSPREWSWAFLLGAIVITLAEGGQIVLQSRVASITSWLLGLVGIGIGAALTLIIQNSWIKRVSNALQRPWYRSTSVWVLASLAYSAAIAGVFWAPFQIVQDDVLMSTRFRGLLTPPLSIRHQGSDVVAMFGLLRNTLWWIPLGVFLGLIVASEDGAAFRRRAWSIATWSWMIAWSITLELGQCVLKDHAGDSADIVARLFGAVIGLALLWCLVPEHGTRSFHRHRSERGRENKPGISMRPRPRVAGLDGLRALACVAVFGVHWQQLTGVSGFWGPFDLKQTLENGNTGVALFFSLSGFLLALPLWTHPPAQRVEQTLSGFGRSRVVRILPEYYACLSGLVLLHVAWGAPPRLYDTLLHFAAVHNYVDASFYAISPPFWTIAVQIQFYIVFAVVVWVLGQSGATSNRSLAVVFAGLCAACYGLHALITHFVLEGGGVPGPVLTHSVLAHLPLFFLGNLAAGAFVHIGRRSTRNENGSLTWDVIFAIAMLSVLAILTTGLDAVCQIPYGRYHFPFIPGLLVLMIVAAPLSRVAKALLELPPVRRLGMISYGVYIYHLPCLGAVSTILKQIGLQSELYPAFLGTAGFAMSVAVAAMSYVGIEKPLERWIRGGDSRMRKIAACPEQGEVTER